jgi:hypothetical protein
MIALLSLDFVILNTPQSRDSGYASNDFLD